MQKKSFKTLRVSCQMTDLDVLERLQSIFGGSVCKSSKTQEHYKDAWVWSINGSDKAARCMEAILPYMGKRRSSKIQELLMLKQSWDSAKVESEENIRNAVEAYVSGEGSYRQIASKFGVSYTTVWNRVRSLEN